MSNRQAARSLAMFATTFMICSCVGRPGFIPTTRHLYSRFTPLAEPRPAVPVGALWIDGYGATGEGAEADNVVTTRSLSGFTFDADFQASLTLGLLKFLDLDPSIRKKIVARFSDLSIIQVKDWSKLPGPTGEPRIYEALKAGTISITTTGTAGLDIEGQALSQNTQLVGRGTTGLARTFIIDGKDLVFAIHVATYRAVQTESVNIAVSLKRPGTAVLGRYAFGLSVVDETPSIDPNGCVQKLGYRLTSRQQDGANSAGTIDLDPKGGEKVIDMPVPEEGLGGALLTQVRVSWPPQSSSKCPASTITAQRIGRGIIRLTDPKAPGW